MSHRFSGREFLGLRIEFVGLFPDAEARLFQVWLASGRIAGPADSCFGGLVDPTEYLGGVADFTGEVGRYAVQAASRRDGAAVRASLAVDQACWNAWMRLELPGKLAKKEGALRQNTTKVEGLLYDLSVVKSSAGGASGPPGGRAGEGGADGAEG